MESGGEYTGYFTISAPQPTPTSVFAYLPLLLTNGGVVIMGGFDGSQCNDVWRLGFDD